MSSYNKNKWINIDRLAMRKVIEKYDRRINRDRKRGAPDPKKTKRLFRKLKCAKEDLKYYDNRLLNDVAEELAPILRKRFKKSKKYFIEWTEDQIN